MTKLLRFSCGYGMDNKKGSLSVTESLGKMITIFAEKENPPLPPSGR